MKGMNSYVIWIAVTIIAAATVVFLWSRGRGEWGFREAVENPEKWRREVERANQAFERATEEAKHWDDAQIAEEVRRFVFETPNSRDGEGKAAVLKSLGARIHPAVLQILGDASQQTRLVAPTVKAALPETPFNLACDLLGDDPPTNAAALIAPFVEQPNKEVRKEAAMILGTIGTPEVVVPLRKIFSDPDGYVRSYGLMGLQRAQGLKRLDARCASDLYGDIAQLIISPPAKDMSLSLREATQLLLQIDPSRTTELFLSEKILTLNSPSLDKVLSALAEKQIAVPRERLLTLINELEKSEMKFPHARALGEALHLLGQHKLPNDRALLEARTAHAEPRVAEGASAGLIALSGLEGFEKRTWETAEKDGFAALKPAQRHYLAVLAYDGEVNNGGLSQYFFNSSGDNWADALAGLEAMGFNERLAVLREAVGKFGKGGPSQERERRQEQLAKLERKSDALFDALGDRYYKSGEVVDVLARKYVLKNAEAFR
jgi:HEAT repeat protein